MKQITLQADSPTNNWIECRLFFSSTFKDFHGERDYLHTQWQGRRISKYWHRKDLRIHTSAFRPIWTPQLLATERLEDAPALHSMATPTPAGVERP